VIDHVGLGVSDLERSRAFNEQALAPLGYQVLIERNSSLGFGHNAKPDFFIHINRPLSGPTMSPSPARTGPPWTPSTPPAWPPAAATTALPAHAPKYHQHYYGGRCGCW
jgi:catechol 2,3-dioxygenase-like lactoylglutathione lyase family enzyme